MANGIMQLKMSFIIEKTFSAVIANVNINKHIFLLLFSFWKTEKEQILVNLIEWKPNFKA